MFYEASVIAIERNFNHSINYDFVLLESLKYGFSQDS